MYKHQGVSGGKREIPVFFKKLKRKKLSLKIQFIMSRLNTLLTHAMNLRHFDGLSGLFNSNILAAYWQGGDIEIYKLSRDTCEKLTGRSLHELKPCQDIRKKGPDCGEKLPFPYQEAISARNA